MRLNGRKRYVLETSHRAESGLGGEHRNFDELPGKAASEKAVNCIEVSRTFARQSASQGRGLAEAHS
jgi:hypothetical protein